MGFAPKIWLNITYVEISENYWHVQYPFDMDNPTDEC
jgi:hypothetical protein